MPSYTDSTHPRAVRRSGALSGSTPAVAEACGVVLVFLLASVSSAADRQVVDRISAVIEDEIVTLRELEAKAAPYMGQVAGIEDAEQRAKRREEILRQVLDIEIGEKMVAREIESNRERLGVTEADVDRAVEEVLRINHLSREQLQAALYGQGLTWAEYRSKLREQIERARLIQFKVQGKVQVKDADVRRRCLQRQKAGAQQIRVCAAHVLLKIPRDAAPEDVEKLRARGSKLQAELSAGADFAAYALKYSDDKAAPDGALGCFSRGEMVEQFERAAFALPVGGVSPVVRTDFGFHIIKVTDRRSASTSGCSDEEDLASFRDELYQEEMERQMNNWVGELRRRAFVDVRL